MVAELFEDAAHDAVTARVNLDAGLIAVGLGGIADSIGMNGPIFQLNAVGDGLHVVFGDILVNPYVVDLFLHILGVCELGCEIAVVGEQEYAGGVAVETTYGVYAFVAGTLNQIEYSGASVWIVACCYAILGLVEQDVCLALECDYLLVVFDNVLACDLCAEFGNDFAIYLHKALTDEVVGFAARADTCIGHILVQTYLLIGIGSGQFVFYSFGTRSEALATLGHTEAVLTGLLAVLTERTLLTLITALTLLAVGALLTLLVTALLLTVRALLTGLITAFTVMVVVVVALTGLIAILLLVVAVGVLTVRALLTWLITALLLAVGALLTLLIAALLLTVGALLAGLVAALLTGLIATLLIMLAGLVRRISLTVERAALLCRILSVGSCRFFASRSRTGLIRAGLIRCRALIATLLLSVLARLVATLII